MKKVVLVTGVAGGIGSATAKVFADAGWIVIGVDRREMGNILGVSHFICADISSPDVPEKIFNKVASLEGRLDAVVNNAALQICKPLVETSIEEWDAILASNVRSVFLSARYAFPFLKNSGGSIINVSSVHAIATSTGISAYAASKGALLALTRAMALEFGPEGIRVNAVLPGAVDTPMLHAGLGRGHLSGDGIDELVRGLGKKHVLGRVGQPEEIGQTILFLAESEKSSFITGQAIVVDGGATARLSTE